MKRLAVSWSGGKDGCLAYWKMSCNEEEIDFMLNIVRQETERVAFHGIRKDLIQEQAESLGLSLIQKQVDDRNYKQKFSEGLHDLKAKGIEGVIFGDIDIEENRKWCEDRCREAGLTSHFPLWGIQQNSLLEEFIEAGFKAIVVAVDSSYFERDALGKRLDRSWIESLEKSGSRGKYNISTFCGENGEYHTFVYDGPPFYHEIGISLGEEVQKNNHWLIDVCKSPGRK